MDIEQKILTIQGKIAVARMHQKNLRDEVLQLSKDLNELLIVKMKEEL